MTELIYNELAIVFTGTLLAALIAGFILLYFQTKRVFFLYLTFCLGLVCVVMVVGFIEYRSNSTQTQTSAQNPAATNPLPPNTGISTPTLPLTLRIPGNSNQGLKIEIPKTGSYQFAYKEGAYSTYAIGKAPSDYLPWLTAVLVFKGSAVPWDGERIMDEDILFSAANTQNSLTQQEAIDRARGKSTSFDLYGGEMLTFVAIDSQTAYLDNVGYVDIDCYFLGN